MIFDKIPRGLLVPLFFGEISVNGNTSVSTSTDLNPLSISCAGATDHISFAFNNPCEIYINDVLAGTQWYSTSFWANHGISQTVDNAIGLKNLTDSNIRVKIVMIATENGFNYGLPSDNLSFVDHGDGTLTFCLSKADWQFDSTTSTLGIATINANKSTFNSFATVEPNIEQVANGIIKFGLEQAVLDAIQQLTGDVEWVLDQFNNQINYKIAANPNVWEGVNDGLLYPTAEASCRAFTDTLNNNGGGGLYNYVAVENVQEFSATCVIKYFYNNENNEYQLSAVSGNDQEDKILSFSEIAAKIIENAKGLNTDPLDAYNQYYWRSNSNVPFSITDQASANDACAMEVGATGWWGNTIAEKVNDATYKCTGTAITAELAYIDRYLNSNYNPDAVNELQVAANAFIADVANPNLWQQDYQFNLIEIKQQFEANKA